MAARAYKQWTELEDEHLRKVIGTQTAESIGKTLGRTGKSVSERIRILGLDGTLKGEAKVTAKLTEKDVEICRILNDYGYKISDMRRFGSAVTEAGYMTLKDIIDGRTWKS